MVQSLAIAAASPAGLTCRLVFACSIASVLVQRETESGRSPLASIAPFSEVQFEPSNVGYRKGQWVETALGGPIHHKVSCARVVDWVSWLIGSAQIQLATKRIFESHTWSGI